MGEVFLASPKMSPHWVTFGAAVVTMASALAGTYLARGSTAVPAMVWAATAALALAGEAAATASGWLRDPASQASARVVVVALGVCPAMSILGAKRPQHGVWQFIVATLACVLSMPAFTAVLVRPGSLPDLHIIEQCFLPLLVVIGWLNFAATQRSVAAIMVASGQMALLWACLPMIGLGQPLSGPVEAAWAWAIAGGSVLAAVQAAMRPAAAGAVGSPVPAINGPFLAFRETLGAAWTLRVMERFNVVAAERGWPCRLRFGGLLLVQDNEGGRWEVEAERCARALLRRFASVTWIGRHERPRPISSPISLGRVS